VIKTVRALAGDGAPPDTHGIMGLPVAYVHRRLHHPELFKGLTPRLATAALDRAGIAYDRHSKTGTILHIAGGLRRCGFVETTSIAATLDSARLLDEQAEAVLLVAARDRVAAARPGDPAAR
jgi:hypothetical protein